MGERASITVLRLASFLAVPVYEVVDPEPESVEDADQPKQHEYCRQHFARYFEEQKPTIPSAVFTYSHFVPSAAML